MQFFVILLMILCQHYYIENYLIIRGFLYPDQSLWVLSLERDLEFIVKKRMSIQKDFRVLSTINTLFTFAIFLLHVFWLSKNHQYQIVGYLQSVTIHSLQEMQFLHYLYLGEANFIQQKKVDFDLGQSHHSLWLINITDSSRIDQV